MKRASLSASGPTVETNHLPLRSGPPMFWWETHDLLRTPLSSISGFCRARASVVSAALVLTSHSSTRGTQRTKSRPAPPSFLFLLVSLPTFFGLPHCALRQYRAPSYKHNTIKSSSCNNEKHEYNVWIYRRPNKNRCIKLLFKKTL